MYKVPQLNTFNNPRTFVPQVDYRSREYPLPPYFAPPPQQQSIQPHYYPGNQQYIPPNEQYYLNNRNCNQNYLQDPYQYKPPQNQDDPLEHYYNYDEINEPAPIIYFKPPQFEPEIRSQDYGFPKGYLEQEQLNQRKEQFTEHIQNQVKYGQKMQAKAKKDLRKRWEIKDFYLTLEASVNEKGLVSFNNYKYPQKPANQVYFETEPQDPSVDEVEDDLNESEEQEAQQKSEQQSKKQKAIE